MLNFCGITSVWQNRPHKSLPWFHAYPCQRAASGKSPRALPVPLPGMLPCLGITHQAEKHTLPKPAEPGSKSWEETFPTRMQMIHRRIPLEASEFACRSRSAGCYHKPQETPSLRGIKPSTRGRKAKGRCGAARGNLSRTA